MKTPVTILSLGIVLGASPAIAADGKPIEWKPAVINGTAIIEWTDTTDGKELKISNGKGEPTAVQLGVLESPEVKSNFYGIDGRVRHEGVEGVGYLEMWNHFPAGAKGQPTAFFSRTLAESGLMKKLSGDSGLRPFRLPFNAEGTDARPSRLVVNLHLPGKGSVYLQLGALRDYPDAGTLFSQLGSWWPVTASGWIGGIFGTVFGCWGGLIGYLSQKGRARSFVMASWVINIAAGLLSLMVGLTALAMAQPYHVWYPLLLIGVILPVVLLGNRKKIMANYAEVEERRMAAVDAVAR